MSAFPNILGLDIGSVSISAALLNSRQEIVQSAYAFHRGNPAEKLKELLSQFDLTAIGGIAATSATPGILKATRRYDSRVAVLKAVYRLHAKAGSILVVGGEQFGLIRLDKNGDYLGFKSNTGCAAGTGSFLDQQARRLNLSGADELSRIACRNTGAVPKIATRCAVFAKTDLVHAQQEGRTLAQICDGLCLGLARNIFDTLFTADDFCGPIIFTGGVSLNRAVVRHLRALTGQEIHTDGTLLYGAVGAALSLADEHPAAACGRFASPEDIIIPRESRLHYFHEPLDATLSDYPDFEGLESYRFRAGNAKTALAVEVDVYRDLKPFRQLTAWLGVDVGSTSTKAVLVDSNRTVVAGFYTRTAGKPVAAAQAILAAIRDVTVKNGIDLTIGGAATTGAGRKFIGRVIGADMVIDEITTHARAAV